MLTRTLLLLLALASALVTAKTSFIRRVPYVPPEWPATGHPHPYDGQGLNQFGLDFRKAGNQWTRELCLMDSDGDGRTNGEESGDWNCVWAVGQPTPQVPYKLSNHGVFDVFDPEDDLIFLNATGKLGGATPQPTVASQPTLQPTSGVSSPPSTTVRTSTPTSSSSMGAEDPMTVEPWLIAHVVLGALSVGLLFPVATGMTTVCRRRVGGDWKDVHVYLSIIATVMFLVAFILPLAIMDEDDIPGVIVSTHGISAILLFVVMFFQSLTGSMLFFCRMRGPNWLTHSLLGNLIASLMGLIVIVSGYDLMVAELYGNRQYGDVPTLQALGAINCLGYIVFWLFHFRFIVQRRFKSIVRMAEKHNPFSSSRSDGAVGGGGIGEPVRVPGGKITSSNPEAPGDSNQTTSSGSQGEDGNGDHDLLLKSSNNPSLQMGLIRDSNDALAAV